MDHHAWTLYDLPECEPRNKAVLCGAPPLLCRLWKRNLWEIERNDCVETQYGTVFSAADGNKYFIAKLFNRDVAFSGILGLNALYPQEMLTSLKIIRKIRFERGWHCPKGMYVQNLAQVTIDETMGNREYILKYGKSTPANKTDDVVWLWAFYDLLCRHTFPESEWAWLYEHGKRSFEELYAPFFDTQDGLYFGQPTFIDVGSNGYPNELRQGQDELDGLNACIWVKASSTNALYYAGLMAMSRACAHLGKQEETKDYQSRAARLAKSIRHHLRFADGTFAYFKHRDGRLEPRREALGTALPVILGIVAGEDAQAAVAGYPWTPWGAPLFYPDIDNEECYHNQSAWPFASTLFSAAVEIATGESTAFENLVMLINALKNGAFQEVFDMRTHEITGGHGQLWSEAAFVNACARAGYTHFSGEMNPFGR